MEFLPGPAVDQLRMPDVLSALADPVRLWMIGLLADGAERSCSPAGFPIELHKSTLSHHYKVLREAGVTSTRIQGRHRYVRLRWEDLQARFPGLLDAVIAGVLADPSTSQGPTPADTVPLGSTPTGAGPTGAGSTGAGSTGAGSTGAGLTGAGSTGAGPTGAGGSGPAGPVEPVVASG